MHLTPEARPDEEALGRRIQHHALLAAAVEEAESYGTSDADAELAEFLVGMEAAADVQLGAVNPVDAADGERERPAELGNGEHAANVATLWDIDELD